MKRVLLQVVCLWIMSFHGALYSFVYNANVLRLHMDAMHDYQYVIGASDFHDKWHHANDAQRTMLERILNGCSKRDTLVITEDLSSCNVNGCRGCANFTINSSKGILAGLTTYCSNHWIPVVNVEYRYCRVAALGPVINNITAVPTTFPSTNSITVQQLIDEVNKIIDEVSKYNNSKTLHTEYKKHIDHIKTYMKNLKMFEHATKTVAEYIQVTTTPANRMARVKELLTFDSVLLDMRIIHEILKAPTKKQIVIFAGGTHIENVSHWLQKIGYKPERSGNIKYEQERNLERCIGSHIVDGSFCVKPQPIGLDVISSYVK